MNRPNCLLLSTSHTGLPTRLRPVGGREMLESWENRRKGVRLVAEVVGGRQGKISRSKVQNVIAHIADRSHLGPIATNRTIKISYDPV